MERGGEYVWIANRHTYPKRRPSLAKAYTVIRGLEEFAAVREQF